MSDVLPFMMTPLFAPPEPKLVICRQPKKRGYRFRYSSEGQTHGGIPGEPDKNNDKAKLYPTLKLLNHNGPAKVVVTLVTADPCAQSHLHPHSLIVNKVMTKGYHIYEMPVGQATLELRSIAIQHVVKERLPDTLMNRILSTRYIKAFGWNSGLNSTGVGSEEMFDVSHYVQALNDTENTSRPYVDRATARAIAGLELENLKKEATKLAKDILMNQVRLCFQAFLPDARGKYTQVLEAVYSDIIYDGKTKQGSMLKIIRISKVSCTVQGDEEVWIIADKINADDIEVRFFEHVNQGSFIQPWEDFGIFNKTEIYKQCVLVFKTPPYRDQNIRQPANVWIQLRRKNDQSCCSDPMEFKYTPIHHDRYGIGEKRKKEIPSHDTFQYLPKKRYDTPPISELPSQDILANASGIDNYSYSAPAFLMQTDPASALSLSFLKQEDDITESSIANQNQVFSQIYPQFNNQSEMQPMHNGLTTPPSLADNSTGIEGISFNTLTNFLTQSMTEEQIQSIIESTAGEVNGQS